MKDEERLLARICANPRRALQLENIRVFLAEVRADERLKCLRAVNCASLTGPWEGMHQEAFQAAARAITENDDA